MDSFSKHHCVFCNKLLVENKAKLLNCMHVICEECEEHKKYDSRLRCKCDEFTEGELLNISIEPPDNISKIKLCNNDNCNELASKLCLACIHFYCKPCSKVHLNSNSEYHRRLTIPHPIPKDEYFIKCSNCKVKLVEVCCNKCAVLLCSLCQLNNHKSHKHIELRHLVQDTKSKINIEIVDLEKNNKYLNQHIMDTEIKFEDLEAQKIRIYKEIDNQFEKLRKKLDQHVMKTKYVLNDYIKDATLKVKRNVDKLKDMEKNNTYLMNITETIVNNYNMTDIVKLSQFSISSLKSANRYTLNVHNYINDVSKNMQFIYDESIQNSISSIKITGEIIAPNGFNLSKIVENCVLNNPVQSNCLMDICNNDNKVINNEEILISDNSIIKSTTLCACCNQWSEQMSKCKSCERFYHNTCHIPFLETTVHEVLEPNWKCTMCIDILEKSKGNPKSMEDISDDKIEWKLIERLLMELYCRNNDSELFRNCPNNIIYPCYYKIVFKPISLNDIKKRHNSVVPYDSMIDFILEVKRIFSNAKLYYHERDPYYKSIIDLEKFFNSMLTSWIPEIHNFI